MPRDNRFLRLLSRVLALPVRLRPPGAFRAPRKAIIIQPGFLSQVLLTTPLLAALARAFPDAQFDWAVGAWARPAVATHPLVSELVDTGRVGLVERHWEDWPRLVRLLRHVQRWKRRPFQLREWSPARFAELGLHRLVGTIRYPGLVRAT